MAKIQELSHLICGQKKTSHLNHIHLQQSRVPWWERDLQVKSGWGEGESKNLVLIYKTITKCKVIHSCLRSSWSSLKGQWLENCDRSIILFHMYTHTYSRRRVLTQSHAWNLTNHSQARKWPLSDQYHGPLPDSKAHSITCGEKKDTVLHFQTFRWKQWFIIYCHLSNLWSLKTSVNGGSCGDWLLLPLGQYNVPTTGYEWIMTGLEEALGVMISTV